MVAYRRTATPEIDSSGRSSLKPCSREAVSDSFAGVMRQDSVLMNLEVSRCPRRHPAAMPQDDIQRQCQAERASRDPQAIPRQGAAHIRQGARQRGEGVRGGRTCPPRRLRRVEALVREARRPLGAEGSTRSLGPAREEPRARVNHGKNYRGVDAEANSKQELYRRARDVGIEGRSQMTKGQLAETIARRQLRRGRSR
jgi:hypothetical protein